MKARPSLERVLFAVAGVVTLASVGLGAFVSPSFLLLTALVGANQLLFFAVGDYPMSLLLRRTCGLKGAAR